MSSPIRVANVITGLERGGAEVMLERMLERIDRDRFEPSVVSLTGPGALGPRIEAAGTPVSALGLRSVPGPLGVTHLARELRHSSAAVVQTWLLHANVLAGGLSRLSRVPVCWSMHMTAAEAGTHGRATVALQRLEARISARVPARIVSCSYSTYELMARTGYAMERAEVVPNGFDVERLRPDPAAGSSLREELGIPPNAPLVAHAARFHPMKDHHTLLDAASRVLADAPDTRFVLCGTGVEEANAELAALAAPLGDRVRLLGPRDDVTRIFQAADACVLSSASGEAMPLVIGEAMACGTPVVSTDCGDSAELVGETGRIVPVRRADLLAGALSELLGLAPDARRDLGLRARDRIAERYSLRAMVAGYERIWAELASSRAA